MENREQNRNHRRNVELKGNAIYLYNLNHPACVSDFIRRIRICIEKE